MITAIILATVILTLVLSIWLRSSKGQIGEKRVARILGRLPKDRYLVINNMLLRTASGGTTFMVLLPFQQFIVYHPSHNSRIQDYYTCKVYTFSWIKRRIQIPDLARLTEYLRPGL